VFHSATLASCCSKAAWLRITPASSGARGG
jgi:hypothetical protein